MLICFGKKSQGSAEILLTKQAFNFRFRNIKWRAWKKMSKANQRIHRKETDIYTATGEPQPHDSQHLACNWAPVCTTIYRNQKTTMFKNSWHLGGLPDSFRCCCCIHSSHIVRSHEHAVDTTTVNVMCESGLQSLYTTMA